MFCSVARARINRKTTSMWDWAESVVEITNATIVFAVHVLALKYETNFALIKLTILAFNFAVELRRAHDALVR